MSRIGNAIVTIPEGVTITVDKDNVVTVKGKKGELTAGYSFFFFFLTGRQQLWGSKIVNILWNEYIQE